MSRESRLLAGILLIVPPTVMYGGVSILSLLIGEPAYMANKLRQDGSPGTAVMDPKMSWKQGAFLCDDSGIDGVGEESRWTT